MAFSAPRPHLDQFAALLVLTVFTLLTLVSPSEAATRMISSMRTTTTESTAAQVARDAETMLADAVDAESAFSSLLSRYPIDLVEAECGLASAGYGPAARNGAVQNEFTVESATARLRNRGYRPRDVYLELSGYGHSPEVSAGSVADAFEPAAVEEVAEAMVLDGVSLEEVVVFLRYMGWTVDEIMDFLAEVANATEERILAALVRIIAFGADATDVELDAIASRLAALFGKVVDAAAFLEGVGGAGWERIAALLGRAGYAAKDIAAHLYDVVGIAPKRIAQFLKEKLALSVNVAFTALRLAGVETADAARAIAEIFGGGAARIAQLMRSAGANAAAVVSALLSKYGSAITGQLYDLLIDAGYSATQAQQALSDIMNNLHNSSMNAIRNIR